jgi:hypothetical protein
MFTKQILHDQFIQSWYSDINNSSSGHFYSSYKTDFVLEKYLINLKKCRRIQISKSRCSNNKFPMETGRWTGTPRIERICVLCNNGSIGDELHYLYICQKEQIQRLRAKFIPSYYFNNPYQNKLNGTLSICNKTVLNNVAIFIEKICKLL